MADVYAEKTAARHAAAQGATARATERLADAHTRQAAALERMAAALEALLDADGEGREAGQPVAQEGEGRG